MKPTRTDGGSRIARSQAARLLRTILQGDAAHSAVGSIKSLIYQPHIRNKKATMALVCQTLKYLPIIKGVLEQASVLEKKKKIRFVEGFYVATYELLFGKELRPIGEIENVILSRKNALRAALARLLVKKNVSCVEDLLPAENGDAGLQVQYVRTNTLKTEVNTALDVLRETMQVDVDDLVPGLFSLPADIDLHRHPLVLNGSLILQGKASCIPALALAPENDWVVLDACAAPGNKTVQLSALMNGKGQVLACELNKNRIKRLLQVVEIAGASNVKVMHQDFLKLDVSNPALSRVKAILLDPSCSGSGTRRRRLDHLLPSSREVPAVQRVVYSTCSVHQQENEDVVGAVLDFADTKGFRLGHPIPQWHQRGLPVFEGANNLLRINPSEKMDGFFVALFERSVVETDSKQIHENGGFNDNCRRKKGKKRKRIYERKKPA